MPEDTLQIRTMRLEGTLCAIVSGELDTVSAKELTALEEMLAVRPSCFILDLMGVNYMDSTGLQALLTLHRAAQKSRTPMQVHVRNHSSTLRVMRMVGADKLLSIVTEPALQESRRTG